MSILYFLCLYSEILGEGSDSEDGSGSSGEDTSEEESEGQAFLARDV